METRFDRRDRVALLGCAGLVATAIAVGVVYVHIHAPRSVGVPAAPWAAHWQLDPAVLLRAIVPAVIAAYAAWRLPTVAARASWPAVVAIGIAVVVILSFALAWSGPASTHWTSMQFEYGQHAHLVQDWGGPAAFLRRYVQEQPHLATHLRAHPPGLVLLLWSASQLGASGTHFQLALMLAGGAIATVAALVAAKEVAGTTLARAAMPFVVLAPVVVWRTNPDVVFGAVALTGVALFLLATSRRGPVATALAIGGGLVFAAALFLTYGVTLLALPAIAVAWQRRRLTLLGWAGFGVALGVAVPALWGFSWFAGLAETHRQYQASIAHERGYIYWLLGNAAVFVALIGPATVAGLARLRDLSTSTQGLVVGALAAPVLAGLSGLSSAETERIWQPFVPLVLVAGAALWLRGDGFYEGGARRWLAMQAGVAILFQVLLRTPW